MKPVSANFIKYRNRTQPPPTAKKVFLTEYELDGTLLNTYNLSQYLKGGLPLIDQDIEKEMNKFITGEKTLKFHDPDKSNENILNHSNRFFGLKTKEGFNIFNPIVLDSETLAYNTWRISFNPDCQYLFAINDATFSMSSYFRKFAINDDTGVISLRLSKLTGYSNIVNFVVTADYIYAVLTTGRILIFNYDGDIVGTVDDGLAYTNFFRILVSPDENYSWISAYSGNVGTEVFDTSDKNNPTFIGRCDAVHYNAYWCFYFDDKLYISDYTNKYLRIYDASNPAVVPYSLISSVDLGFYNNHFIFDEQRAILYITGTGGTAILDMCKPDIPTIIEKITSTGYKSSTWGRGCKIDNKLFINNSDTDKIYIIDTGNHYQLKSSTEVGLPAYYRNIDVVHNNSNIIAWVGRTDLGGGEESSTLYTYAIREDWLTIFDGIIDTQRITRRGRNDLSLTAHTWEREFENHNAELVFDADNMPFRNITGIYIQAIYGGQPGLKTLTYKNKSDQAGNLYEFQYEGGPSVTVTSSGGVELYNESGDQLLKIYFNDDYALDENAEDTFLIGDSMSKADTGYWYQAEDVATIVEKLFDTSVINILTQTIDVNDVILTLDRSQFLYFEKTYNEKISFKDACAKTSYKSLNVGNIFVHGTDVFSYTWSKDDLSFSKTWKFDIKTYLADAIFVEKILTDVHGNRILVCVKEITGLADNEDWSQRKYYVLSGIVKVDSSGAYVAHWTSAQMDTTPSSWTQWLLAKSFSWASIGAPGILIYEEFQIYSDHVISVHALAFDTLTTGTIVADEERDVGDVGYEYGQGIAAYYNFITNEIDRFWVMEFRNDTQTSRLIWQNKDAGDSDWETIEEMDYATDDIFGQFQSKDGSNNWCLYSEPRDASEERRQFFFTFQVNDTIWPTDYWTGIAVSNISNSGVSPWGYISGWWLDDDGFQESIVDIEINTVGGLPDFEIIQTGFFGSGYKMYSAPYYDGTDWIGVATAGYSNTLIVWCISNISKNIVHIADFSDYNIRQALNELATGFICAWTRAERDKAFFISRGNFVDTYILENSLYKSDFAIERTDPYIGVEVKSSLYPEYVYRYPDNFNAEQGKVFKLENRYIYPINGYANAKTYGDWLIKIREIPKVNSFFLIELEPFDKIEFKLYDKDGVFDRQIDCILMGKSFDDRNKRVELNLLDKDGYFYKETLFRPRYFAV